MTQLDRTFEALASATRRQMLAVLAEDELTTSDLAERFGLGAPAISRHLSILEGAGLVAGERRGQRVYYRVEKDNLVNRLTGFAFEVCPVAGPMKRQARAIARRRRET
jgi:DNA-binding transcriptional ArsR family regulator